MAIPSTNLSVHEHLPDPRAGVDDESAWEALRQWWSLDAGLTYLNHGSFGPPPRPVVEAQRRVLAETAGNPMAMFVDRYEQGHIAARDRLADLVGADRRNLVLVENATYAMNVVAAGFPLRGGDEVLITDHDYGAVARTWQRACRRAGARLVTVPLPLPAESAGQYVDAVLGGVTPRTRLLVISHVTSPTALRLPVEEICRRAAGRGVRTCLDGPHALAALPLSLDRLGCDFYTASCHKWLSGPPGTGFLYARPEVQGLLEPLVVSWGRSPPAVPESWQDWFVWVGTRDPGPILALPAAIDFLEAVGWDRFRARTHYLARQARERLLSLGGFSPLAPDEETWYGPMVAVRTEHAEADDLRRVLRERHRIEVPVIAWQGGSLVRVSCHLYTQIADLERLAAALKQELGDRATKRV